MPTMPPSGVRPEGDAVFRLRDLIEASQSGVLQISRDHFTIERMVDPFFVVESSRSRLDEGQLPLGWNRPVDTSW